MAPLAAVTVDVDRVRALLRAVAGGVAVTLTVPLPPASIVTVSALASAVGEAVTVQPCGAVGSNVNVCSSGVLLVTVRL